MGNTPATESLASTSATPSSPKQTKTRTSSASSSSSCSDPTTTTPSSAQTENSATGGAKGSSTSGSGGGGNSATAKGSSGSGGSKASPSGSVGNNSNAASSSSSSSSYQWQWYNDVLKKFVDFDQTSNDLIEQGYASKKPHVILSHGFFSNSPGGYKIEFATMKQINVKTNFKRTIKRSTASATSSVAVSTTSPAPSGVNKNLSSKMIRVTQEQIDKLVDPEAPGFNQPEKSKTEGCRKLTNWKVLNFNKDKVTGSCPICLCDFEPDETIVQLSKCSHQFHSTCIVHCYKHEQSFLKCPVCPQVYGTRMGNMPKGTMTVIKTAKGVTPLAGFPNCGTITITYAFEGGTQGPEHRNPGAPYSGTSRVCYLPDNEEGNKILALLDIAFKRRLTFTIGQSVTSGADNTVVWNGIHHKTATSGGTSGYGYPDDTYFTRVRGELKDVGVE